MQIVVYPNDVLKKAAQPVESIDDAVRQTVQEMIEVMYKNGGIGLAAPQVGLSQRIIVVCPTNERGKEVAYINPTILKKKGREIAEEGCLSFPKIYGHVARATWIQVSAQLLTGEKVIFEAEDFPARVLQHEIDHLNGIIFINKFQPADKVVTKKLVEDLEKAAKS